MIDAEEGGRCRISPTKGTAFAFSLHGTYRQGPDQAARNGAPCRRPDGSHRTVYGLVFDTAAFKVANIVYRRLIGIQEKVHERQSSYNDNLTNALYACALRKPPSSLDIYRSARNHSQARTG